MKIEIHPGHIGAAARKKDARRLVTALRSLDWPAELVSGDVEAIWDFDSFDDLRDFERDLENIRDRIWPAYEWQETIPCETCGCKCRNKDINGATFLRSVIDYSPSP